MRLRFEMLYQEHVIRILQSSTRAERAVSNHVEHLVGVQGFVAVWISWLWEHPLQVIRPGRIACKFIYLLLKIASGNLQKPIMSSQVLHNTFCIVYYVCNNSHSVRSFILAQCRLSFSVLFKNCSAYNIMNHSANSVFLYNDNSA
jgi:hypothetical protein